MNRSNLTREQKKEIINLAIQEYLNTPDLERSLTKISKKYGVKRQTISKHLKDRGYIVINYQNRCRLNEFVFDNIESEEQFYWLGFLYADGNISTTGNRLEVRLSIKDLNHLEKFRKFLNLENTIRTGICNGNEFCHLSVRNKHVWQSLYNLGCIPAKSLILEFPNFKIFKSIENVFHFIRGYVDGDGCLSIYKNKNTLNTTLSIVGTKNFLNKINLIFNNIGYIRNKSCKNWENKAYNLNFSPVISRIIANYLYQNATIYLDRKHEKYKKFCLLEEESSRRKSSKIGEYCNVNPEVISEITKGLETPLSVESE